jgi:hypothetical protein
MKRLVSFLLLIAMMTNVALSVVEQLHGSPVYETTEWGADDMDEKEKTEKEKESYTFAHHLIVRIGTFSPNTLKGVLIFRNNRLFSECYACLPDLPPEV